MGAKVAPFKISIPDEKLVDIKQRIESYPWHAITSFDSTWTYGPPPQELRAICDYWTNKYNWRERETVMNSLTHFTAKVSDLDIHFVHERGSGKNPQPLLLLHGWPYSFHSYTSLVPRLAHPERFGGREEDAFDVIVPSFPGYDFSSKPSKPIFPREVARIMNELMTSVLNYKTYISHGGDWGSYVSELMGFYYPESCVGIHITMSSVRHHGGAPRSGQYTADATEDEKRCAEKEQALWKKEGAYAFLQGTKPLKLAYALLGSPVGVASWILEAFHAWADLRHQTLTEAFSIDQLLDEIMLYLVTDAFPTSIWIYVGDFEDNMWTLPEGRRIDVPVGVIALPDPVFPMPPREVVEKSHKVVQWRHVNNGGHFPFYEVSDVVVQELLEFGKAVRVA